MTADDLISIAIRTTIQRIGGHGSICSAIGSTRHAKSVSRSRICPFSAHNADTAFILTIARLTHCKGQQKITLDFKSVKPCMSVDRICIHGVSKSTKNKCMSSLYCSSTELLHNNQDFYNEKKEHYHSHLRSWIRWRL